MKRKLNQTIYFPREYITYMQLLAWIRLTNKKYVADFCSIFIPNINQYEATVRYINSLQMPEQIIDKIKNNLK